jgi:hypothetical protein
VYKLDAVCYHAARGFLPLLLEELPERDRLDGELVTVSGPRRSVYWTRNVWERPLLIEFSSICEAARILRSIQRNWAPLPTRLTGAAPSSPKNAPLPLKPSLPIRDSAFAMGAFPVSTDRMIASPRCSAHSERRVRVREDKEGPRAGLSKALGSPRALGRSAGHGEKCIERAPRRAAGWALAGLGGRLAIDRAELERGSPYFRMGALCDRCLHPATLGTRPSIGSLGRICYPPPPILIEHWLDSGWPGICMHDSRCRERDSTRRTTDASPRFGSASFLGHHATN